MEELEAFDRNDRKVDVFLVCQSIDTLRKPLIFAKKLKRTQDKWLLLLNRYCKQVPRVLVGTKEDILNPYSSVLPDLKKELEQANLAEMFTVVATCSSLNNRYTPP